MTDPSGAMADRYRMATLSLALLVLCAGTPMRPRLAQCPDGAPPPCSRAAPRPAIQPTSLAVLYFENASRNTVDAYLADGITEEIISRLSEVARLQALDGDDRMIQYLSELNGDSKTADVESLIICGCLRSRLRADPRMQAILQRFGFPRP